MSNNYTPRRAAPSGEPERRRGSSQSGYASERRVPRETGYTPRVPRETGYSSQPRTASRQSGYNPPRQGSASYETRPLRTTQPRDSVPRTSREPRPLRETGRETSTYVRRPAPSRRRRKSGPPILPLVLLLILVVAAVVIFFVARGCSAQPENNGESSTLSQTSQTSSLEGQTSGVDSALSSGGESSAPESSAVSEAPTPAPQEEPQAAPETMGGLLIVEDTAYEFYNFKTDIANQYISAVADAGEKLSGISTLYDMVIPTSIDIDLPESYLEKYTASGQINSSDQRQAIEEYIYPSIQTINSSVKTVSIFDTLKSHANEYLYFRTDHHWTQLGAYYGYVEFCKARGFEPVALDQFDRKDYAGYLGSFYKTSESSALAANPDTVEAYIPRVDVTFNVTQDDGSVLENWPLIADGDTYSQGNKYLVYCGGDQPYEEITNNDMTDGPTCIVVKESFGNCFIPFLVNHYSKIYVIDYRHYKDGTVTQLAQQVGADDVLCLNNISMTRNQDLVDQFSAIF